MRGWPLRNAGKVFLVDKVIAKMASLLLLMAGSEVTPRTCLPRVTRQKDERTFLSDATEEPTWCHIPVISTFWETEARAL